MRRHFLLIFGLTTTALGCYGSFEFMVGLEGRITYLGIAAIIVGMIPAAAPYFAECAWHEGHRLKAILWIVGFSLSVATVFFATNQRVHTANAGALAERSAARSAVDRADTALAEAKAKADRAEADAKAARKLPRAPTSKKAQAGSWCNDACLTRWDTEASGARARVADATNSVNALQAKAVEEGLQSPSSLMPVTLDFIAFLALWNYFSTARKAQERAPEQTSKQVRIEVKKALQKAARRRRKKSKPVRPNPPAAPALRVVG